MVIQTYTYKLLEDEDFMPSVYYKHTPKLACTSIFYRLLRYTHLKELKVVILIKNILTERLYYYECAALYAPSSKKINDKLTISRKWEINILKLNAKCFCESI